jgi:predicted short-subunit dehydrogenase-like oxidoreductase (DUF2520 family)
MSGPGRAVVVGPGRAGLALGYALVQTGAVDALTVCGRRPEPPAHPLFTQGMARYVFGLQPPEPDTVAVFLAVPDAAVPEMAHTLAGQGPPPEECTAFHLSGVLSTDVLSPLHSRGYAIGSFHPLQAIAHSVTGAERISGAYVAVMGEPRAVAVARRLAAAMGSRVLTVPEAWRAQYHAAAVMASNFLPPLLDAACRILERAGVGHEEALPALLSLVRGTLSNIEELGLEAAVTGPVSRGDRETVELHLRALEGGDRRLYAVLGRELVRLAAAGLDPDVRQGMLDRFEEEAKR